MWRLRTVVGMLPAGMMVLGANAAHAQNYPNKPIRIVTAGVGSAGDVASRVMADGLAGSLGQKLVVDNRSSGVIPVEIVAKSPADGYTLLLYGNVIWLSPYLQANVSYDPVRDFSPITLVAISPNILTVHPSLPVKSVGELIALAKARPGELNYESGGAGSSSHLAGELFKSMAGVNIVRIQYKSAGVALSELIGGQVQMGFVPVSELGTHAKTGRLKALAVTSLQPSTLYSTLPTVAAAGLPGYETGSKFSLLAPAKTPDAIIARLNQEVVKFLSSPEAKQRFFDIGAETVGSSPEQLAATIKSEMARMGKVIQDAGIRSE